MPVQHTLPLKLGKDVCHNDSALQSSVCEGVVFEQREEVLAFLHGQTSDQLLNNLASTQKTNSFHTVVFPRHITTDVCRTDLPRTSPAVVWELMEILHEPPP